MPPSWHGVASSMRLWRREAPGCCSPLVFTPSFLPTRPSFPTSLLYIPFLPSSFLTLTPSSYPPFFCYHSLFWGWGIVMYTTVLNISHNKNGLKKKKITGLCFCVYLFWLKGIICIVAPGWLKGTKHSQLTSSVAMGSPIFVQALYFQASQQWRNPSVWMSVTDLSSPRKFTC